MNYLARQVDADFDIGNVTGFGDKIVIPSRVAAEAVLDYFEERQRMFDLVAAMLHHQGHNASGGVLNIQNLPRLKAMVESHGFRYDSRSVRFVRDQNIERTQDWGILKEGEEYRLSILTMDIVGSSELVRRNIKPDVESTMNRFRLYLHYYIENRNGRIWFWHGDGGTAVFFGDNGPRNAILAAIEILSYIPHFNVAYSDLQPEDDIKIRMGIHYGLVKYQEDTSRITGEDLRLAQKLEQEFGEPNSITITETLYDILPQEARRGFHIADEYDGLRLFRFLPL